MPKILKMNVHASENASSTTATVEQASPAVRSLCSRVSVTVIARKAGAVASGSTITNNELIASRMYSDNVTLRQLGTERAKSQTSVAARIHFSVRI